MLDYMIWPWFERFAANSLMFPELALPPHLTALHDWEKAMWTTGLFLLVMFILISYRFVVVFL
jgi:hypothetical protein